ncbi:molecular chaperone SurA [Caenimonas koreensis DSM 17982]|uniref:Chaperone SurA n=1 Tax=Caenimonas koreensis DSM 17982 TaxID=1121255 RepID=A0A844B5I9_9BURK|nr:peptidylprolyl isomerase [Caenimonas koreensis]MRD46919.1 molecular chaperone SurA [Caenimonas koreensis DSM 17982]
MNSRAPLLALACATLISGLHAPAAAQSLRLPFAAAPAPARAVPAGPRAADYIVAVVNSEPITNNEVRMRMARFEQQLAAAGQEIPPRPVFMQQVLERLIAEKAQLQLARENNLRIEESAIDQAEQNIARSNQMDVTELRRQIVLEGMTVAGYREDLRNQLLLTRLREREVEPRIRISDLELDQFLREQQGRTDISAFDLNLGHILVAVPETATPAQVATAREKALRVMQRARAGEDYAKLARENSDASGAATSGGLTGRRPADSLPPIFLQAVQALPEGGVADPIRTTAGFHILKVVEKKRNIALPGATVEQSRARHILLRPGPQLTEAQAVARLADFKKRVEAGQADFAQLARDFSQDASARAGGELGWTSPGSFVPEFEEALNQLKPGQISSPLISRFGVHLVQLMERRQATLTQREQRDMVRSALREKKLDEAYAQWTQEVRGRAFVEMRDAPQ